MELKAHVYIIGKVLNRATRFLKVLSFEIVQRVFQIWYDTLALLIEQLSYIVSAFLLIKYQTSVMSKMYIFI